MSAPRLGKSTGALLSAGMGLGRTLKAVVVGSALAGSAALSLLSGAAPAVAGDAPPVVVIYSTGHHPQVGLHLVARHPGVRGGVLVSAAQGIQGFPSASVDGRVIAYVLVRKDRHSALSYSTIIRKDGVVVRRVAGTASPLGVLIPTVNEAGTKVVLGGDQGLRVYDVASNRIHPLCPNCPEMTSVTRASLSPDGRKVAIIRKINGTEYVEIRRLDTGRRMAIAEASLLAYSAAWNPASDTVAFSTVSAVDPQTSGEVHTLTVSGVESTTAFVGHGSGSLQEIYLSAAWVNGQVWAVKINYSVTDDPATGQPTGSLRAQVVTAADWTATPIAVGEPLYDGPQFWRLELLGFVGWASALPAPAH